MTCFRARRPEAQVWFEVFMSRYRISTSRVSEVGSRLCLSALRPGQARSAKLFLSAGRRPISRLDEARGVLYIANFTANRIEVMSLADHSIQTIDECCVATRRACFVS